MTYTKLRDITYELSAAHHSAPASATVARVSCANRGSTSIDIRPSTPSAAS